MNIRDISFALRKTIWLASIILGLSSCGGGGGGTNTSSNLACAGNTIVAINPGDINNKNIGLDESHCYKVAASENQSYQLILSPSTGDADIAAYTTSAMDDSSLFLYSINQLSSNDELIFTADFSGYYYVEVYGYEASQYTLELREVSTNNYLSVNSINPAINAISTYSLPANQRLIQPPIESQLITATYIGDTGYSTIHFIGSDTLPDWLNIISASGATNTYSYEFSVTHTNLPAGMYTQPVKLTHEVGTNLKVFQIVNLSYELAEPPYVLSSTHVQSAMNNASYSFSLIDDAQAQLTYSIEYAPNGMSIDTNGHVTWLPVMPMFTETMDIHWGIKTTLNDVSIILDGVTSLQTNSFNKPLIKTGMPLSEFTRDGSMVSADWDNDGRTELIITDMEKVLYTLEYNNGRYIEDWANPYSLSDNQKINTLAVGDLNNDGIEELVIGMWQVEPVFYTDTPSANLMVMDGSSKQVVTRITTDFQYIRSIRCADIDLDGDSEVVVFGSTDSIDIIRIYEGISLNLEWSSPELQQNSGISEIEIGNVDADSALEVVSGKGYVIDGISHSLEIFTTNGFSGNAITIGDVDNDGLNDIVYANRLNLYVHDGVTGALKYQINKALQYDGSFEDIAVADISGQGNKYLITSSDKFGGEIVIYLFNSNTNTFGVDRTVKSINYSYSMGIDSLLLDDFDNDGSTELLWRVGGDSTSVDGLEMAGFQGGINSIEIEWYTDNPAEFSSAGFFAPQNVRNLAGEVNIWFMSNDSQVLDGDITIDRGPRLLELNISTGDLTISNPIYSSFFATCDYFANLLAVDLNNDTVKDAIIPPCTYSKPAIVVDLQSSATLYSSSLGLTQQTANGEAEASAVGDFGNNGSHEVVVVTQYGDSYMYNPITNTLLWQYDFGPNMLGVNIFINDLDNNGSLELIVVLDQKIAVFNYNSSGSAFSLAREISLTNITNATIGDINGDGASEIIVAHGGDYNKYLTIYDNNFNSISSIEINRYISSVYIENLPGPRKNIILATIEPVNSSYYNYQVYKLRALDPYNGYEIWQSPSLLGRIPTNSLIYEDVNDDSKLELIFTTDKAINIIY